MTDSNVGSSDEGPKAPVCLLADMEAFDRLPVEFRDKLKVMSLPWPASGVQSIINERGVVVAMNVLDLVEGRSQAAYRRRLALCPA